MPQQTQSARPALDPPAGSEAAPRAGLYSLLAALLRQTPSGELLERVGTLEPAKGRDGLALAWEGLRLAAGQVSEAELDDEYHRLFIGLGRGELVPYGSWYQTGFLMERPLSLLRRELRDLGFERQPDVHEPEDHVAALCEVMAELAGDPEVSVERQRLFYQAHLGTWVQRFCADLQAAPSALFYQAVARLGGEFFSLEERYLEMES